MPRFFEVAVPAPIYPLKKVFTYKVSDEIECRRGSWVRVPFGKRQVVSLVINEGSAPEIAPAKIKGIESSILAEFPLDESRLQLIEWMSSRYNQPIGMIAELFFPGPLRKASEKILLKTLKAATDARNSGQVLPSPFILNAEQEKALQEIRSRPEGVHLLWGVTGSGKTEIYLRLIEETISQGKSALVLVPEISLTPQLISRFEARFPGKVAPYHSALKDTEIRNSWVSFVTGSKQILVGARSALFVPSDRLGMIIMDEEHDSSYKQDESVRYHAREAAETLARLLKIPMVLGSATPSAESFLSAQSDGGTLSILKERAASKAAPSLIEIVDLKSFIGEKNMETSPKAPVNFKAPTIEGDFFLSPPMMLELESCLSKKEQSILFLNRRGVGSQLVCGTCGHFMECPNCAVKLSPHRNSLLCHYCGFTVGHPKACPSCHKESSLKGIGIGTERIEDALKLHFPKARVLRVDRDTIQNIGDLQKTLEAFANGEGDILLGTQMVSKGLDFPRVTLVGVLLADLGLSIPDFRADERALQLLLQVSGRAGRSSLAGKTIIQTFQPDHLVFEALRHPDPMVIYQKFMIEELEKRKLLMYPPYGTLCCLHIDSLSAESAEKAAQHVANALEKARAPGVKILGPIESPIFKIRNRFRFQILLKSGKAENLEKLLSWLMSTWHEKKLEASLSSRLIADINPINML